MADISELVKSEISDFCAGLQSPGYLKTPEDIQRELMDRILPLIKDARREWMVRGVDSLHAIFNEAGTVVSLSFHSAMNTFMLNIANKIRGLEGPFFILLHR